MADHSSFMDWTPQTPEPVFNPYQGNYMPGGWPAEPSTAPPPTTGTFATRRTPPTQFLPAAKRICRGVELAVAYTCATAVAASRSTVTKARDVIAVPAYQIVRRVRERQRQAARPRRPQTPRPALAQATPPLTHTLHGDTDRQSPSQDVRPSPTSSSSRPTALRPAPSTRPRACHATMRDIIYHVPQLQLPSGVKKRRISLSLTTKKKPRDIEGEIRSLQETTTPIPTSQTDAFMRDAPCPPALILTPQATTESPPYSTSCPASPEIQLQRELDAAVRADSAPDVDSDLDSATSDTWDTKKRKRTSPVLANAQGDTENRDKATNPVRTGASSDGPSAMSPTPVIVVEETANIAAPAPLPGHSLQLAPPRVRNRLVGTPISSRRRQRTRPLDTPQWTISVASSVYESPGTFLNPDETAIRSPNDTDISSTYQGSPPNLAEDLRLFQAIMAGGGRPPTTSTDEAGEREDSITSASVNGEQAAVGSSDDLSQQSSEATSSTAHQSDEDGSSPATTDVSLPNTATNPDPENQEILEKKAAENEEVALQEVIILSSEPTTPTRSTADPKRAEHITPEKQQPKHERADVSTPEGKFAQLSLEEQFTPDHPTPKASPHSSEKTQRVTRADTKRLQFQEEAQLYEITPLSAEWEKKMQRALNVGHGDYKATDLTRVVPLRQGGSTDNWLNDEVINGYLKIVVAHGRKNDRPTQVPSHHAFPSFFYNNIATRGVSSVNRWANRAKIGGKNLLDTENVFIPINSGAHWTLCVVSGKNRTITHYNSMAGNGKKYVDLVQGWVKAELGSAYKEDEWKLEFSGESPKQANMDDCGVFAITNARQIMLGLTPMSYRPAQIQTQRQRIVAEIVNGALIKSSHQPE